MSTIVGVKSGAIAGLSFGLTFLLRLVEELLMNTGIARRFVAYGPLTFVALVLGSTLVGIGLGALMGGIFVKTGRIIPTRSMKTKVLVFSLLVWALLSIVAIYPFFPPSLWSFVWALLWSALFYYFFNHWTHKSS